MPGEAIWDGWEDITLTLVKFAWILTLVGGILAIVLGIWNFVWRIVFNPFTAMFYLIYGIIYGGIAITGAVLFIPISKIIADRDYSDVNLVMLIVTAGLAAVGCSGAWFFWCIPHVLVAVFFCFLSEYGWIAKEEAA
ncbi:MAG: hypothetical protein GF329_16940 [Candidatus Lokiarchaeota archaeon]|nr:hypothetical protein [Candidatus Lokiarchaeota archaeon]